VVLTVGILFIRQLVKSGQEQPAKELGPLVHWETCGTRMNYWNRSLPFSKIFVYTDCIEIVAGRRIRLDFDCIKTFELYKAVLSKGVIIRHACRSVPEEIVIWSLAPTKLLQILKNTAEDSQKRGKSEE